MYYNHSARGKYYYTKINNNKKLDTSTHRYPPNKIKGLYGGRDLIKQKRLKFTLLSADKKSVPYPKRPFTNFTFFGWSCL